MNWTLKHFLSAVSTLLSFIIRGHWEYTTGGKGLLFLVLLCCVLTAAPANAAASAYAQPQPLVERTCHQVAGRSLQGMVPLWGVSVCFCCWWISFLVTALARSVLIREDLWDAEPMYNLRCCVKAVHYGVVCYAAKTHLYMLEGAMLWDSFVLG